MVVIKRLWNWLDVLGRLLFLWTLVFGGLALTAYAFLADRIGGWGIALATIGISVVGLGAQFTVRDIKRERALRWTLGLVVAEAPSAGGKLAIGSGDDGYVLRIHVRNEAPEGRFAVHANWIQPDGRVFPYAPWPVAWALSDQAEHLLGEEQNNYLHLFGCPNFNPRLAYAVGPGKDPTQYRVYDQNHKAPLDDVRGVLLEFRKSGSPGVLRKGCRFGWNAAIQQLTLAIDDAVFSEGTR